MEVLLPVIFWEKNWLFVNPCQITKFHGKIQAACSEDWTHVEEYYQGMKSLNITHHKGVH